MKMLSPIEMHSVNAFKHSKPFRTNIFQTELQYNVDRSIQKTKEHHPEHRILSINSETKEEFVETCQENFNQYLLNTTLHGLRYVGDRSITLFERCFFGMMFVLVFFLSMYFIANVWVKWSASPMIIILSAYATPITDFPFPAVTVCNMNQARRKAVLDLPYDSVHYSLVQSLCTSIDSNNSTSKPGKWADFKETLMKVSQPCSAMLVACSYGGFEVNCMDIFTSILTDEGLCCIFNGLSQQYNMKEHYGDLQQLNASEIEIKEDIDWSPEKGYSQEDLKNHNRGSWAPRPAIGTGTGMGLSLLMDVAEDEYYCSSTNSYGFKVLLHSPSEMPKIAYYGTAVANAYETRIVIIPTISEASDSVRKVAKNVRQCLFESENYLTFYRTYSRRNCQMECEAKVYLENCKCVLYYMPRLHDDIIICGRSDNNCVNSVARELQSKTNSSFVCECLPGCFALAYDTEISLSPLLARSPYLSRKKMEASDAALVHIYYKDQSVRSQRKEELIGFTEFLSNTGGLLGLFMGFSVISISELFYFMTIRPYCNYLRISDKRRHKFKRLFRKLRNLRFKKKSDEASNALVLKSIDNVVFPYVE